MTSAHFSYSEHLRPYIADTNAKLQLWSKRVSSIFPITRAIPEKLMFREKNSAIDFTKDDNVERSNKVISYLVEEFSDMKYNGTVVSIEALNEPAAYSPSSGLSATDNNGPLRQFYQVR
jgi:hypothetical protein